MPSEVLESTKGPGLTGGGPSPLPLSLPQNTNGRWKKSEE